MSAPKFVSMGRGVYVDGEARGAHPKGSRIVKCRHEEGDATPIGTEGRVLSSISHPDVHDGAIVYFVEWDNLRGAAVGVIESKVALVK